MSDKTKTFTTRVSGIWNPVHTIEGPDGELGRLSVRRNGWGMVVSGHYEPLKGEKLDFRRDPGILRSQFSLWTEGKEWLAAALRWGFARREVNLSTGSKPMRLVPMPGFRRGWRLIAPKSGEMARVVARPFSRGCRIEVYRRMDFEVVLFGYFLGSQLLIESSWPGPEAESANPAVPSTA
jgi:hypothetical protein